MSINFSLTAAIGVIALCALPGIPAAAADGSDPANYVGSKACSICHKKEETGNQQQKWLNSQHSKAFERLASPEAKEVAAKLGIKDPQTSGACLKCHSTAYHWTETVQAPEKLKPEEGVSCESCHGPGKKYMAKSTMEDRQKSIEAGMLYPASKSCTLCHNEKNPTWNPEKYTTKDGKKVGFDFEQAYEKIKHPNPARK
jgi:hypothetical protein